VDGVVDVSRSVVGDFAFHSGRQFPLDLLHLRANAFDHVHRIRIRQNVNPHEDCFLSREPHLGVVIFRAELDVRDVAQPDEISFLLANDQFFEIIHRVQVGVRGQIDLKQRTFRVTDGREKIISRKHVAHLGRADV
jgi:hypothetical protein